MKTIIKKTIKQFLSDNNFIKIPTWKIEQKFEIRETQKQVEIVQKRIEGLQREIEKLQGHFVFME